jgi:flagellin
MALNVISNFAANVAQRNLRASDAAATDSIAKLSSGSRVNSAKDDAASLAIGSRLRAEVAALKKASVNASQAGSLLQIADGALATVADILIRMKELAVQASSGQFSSIERGVLDSEFQALSEEITRISQDTEFNGTQLISGGAATATNQFAATNFGASGNGFTITADPTVVADNSAFRLSYDTVLSVAQISDITIAVGGGVLAGEVFTAQVTDNAAGQTYQATYTVQTNGEAATVIRDGLIAAINNVVGITVTASASGADVRLTANTAGNGFSTVIVESSVAGSATLTTPTPNVIGGNFLSLFNLTNNTKQTIDVAPIIDGVASAGIGQNLVLTETAQVNFNSIGVTVTLDANFDRTVDHITTGTADDAGIVSAAPTTPTTYVNDVDGGVLNDAITALLASADYAAATGLLSLNLGGAAGITTLQATGIKLAVDGAASSGVTAGAATADLEDGATHTVDLYVTNANGVDIHLGQATVDFAVSAGASSGVITLDVGNLLFGDDVVTGASTQSFSFKIGSGAETYDSLTFSVSAASASTLGVLGTTQGGSVAITTAALADAASASVSAAIDTLNQVRSDIGAAQNRLTFAAANLATAIENAEVARSGMLDLDVAQEITTFTSKQILVQTGVSTLAQANQLPQNLLRLFQ